MVNEILIDVSECRYNCISATKDVCCYAESERGATMKKCADFPNCYYKQLKRKEQDLETICKTFNIEYIRDKETGLITCRCNKLLNKEQECEELQQEIKELREWQAANKATGICETCTHKTLLKNDELRHHVRELDRLNAKYEQALEEIEKLADIREVHGLTDTEYVENFRLHQKRILNIINKVKE